MKSKIILFMPCIDSGGVEKNFFLISNFLAKNIKNVTVITISKNIRNQLNEKINFVSLNYDFCNKLSRRIKFVLGLFFCISLSFFK